MTKVYLLLFLCVMFASFALASTEPYKPRISKLMLYKRQRSSPPPPPQSNPVAGLTGLLDLKSVAPTAPKIPSAPNLTGVLGGGEKDD